MLTSVFDTEWYIWYWMFEYVWMAWRREWLFALALLWVIFFELSCFLFLFPQLRSPASQLLYLCVSWPSEATAALSYLSPQLPLSWVNSYLFPQPCSLGYFFVSYLFFEFLLSYLLFGLSAFLSLLSFPFFESSLVGATSLSCCNFFTTLQFHAFHPTAADEKTQRLAHTWIKYFLAK